MGRGRKEVAMFEVEFSYCVLRVRVSQERGNGGIEIVKYNVGSHEPKAPTLNEVQNAWSEIEQGLAKLLEAE